MELLEEYTDGPHGVEQGLPALPPRLSRKRRDLVIIGHTRDSVGTIEIVVSISLNNLFRDGAEFGVLDDGTSDGDGPPGAEQSFRIQVGTIGTSQVSDVGVLVLRPVAETVAYSIGDGGVEVVRD